MFTSQSLRILIPLWGILTTTTMQVFINSHNINSQYRFVPEAEENLTISDLMKKHRAGGKAFKI